jgi:hypothetical protein
MRVYPPTRLYYALMALDDPGHEEDAAVWMQVLEPPRQ